MRYKPKPLSKVLPAPRIAQRIVSPGSVAFWQTHKLAAMPLGNFRSEPTLSVGLFFADRAGVDSEIQEAIG
jgi:hypothetical protein